MAISMSIINFKGGVGKTTVSLHLAAGISYYHDKKVLLVDVDHQSSLSLICLGKKWGNIVDEGRTINKVFEHFTEGYPMPGSEIIIEAPYGDDYPLLDLVSASLDLDEVELDLASTTKGDTVQSEFIKRNLICEWIDRNNLDEIYDFIIFDCPPATKLVTQNAIAASSLYFVPVIPDAISSRGLEHLTHLLNNKIDSKLAGLADYLKAKGKKIPVSYKRDTILGGVFISKIKSAGNSYSGYTNDHTFHLKNLVDRWGDSIVYPYIEEGTGVTEAMSQGYPVFDKSENKNILNRGFVDVFKKLVDNTLNSIKETTS